MRICMKCGHSNDLTASACDRCGEKLGQERASTTELENVSSVETAERTSAYQQLLDVCEALRQERITSRSFRGLLEEVDHYLQGEITRFESFPEIGLPQYAEGRERVVRGLVRLRESVATAYAIEWDPDVNILAGVLSTALEADQQISAGRRMLEEARRLETHNS